MGNSQDSLIYADLGSFKPLLEGGLDQPAEGYFSDAHPDVLYREQTHTYPSAEESKYQTLRKRIAALPKSVHACISFGQTTNRDGSVTEKYLYSQGTYTLEDLVRSGKVQQPSKELFYTVLADLIKAGADLESQFEVHRDIAQASVSVHPNPQLMLSNPYLVPDYLAETVDNKMRWLTSSGSNFASLHTNMRERAARGQNEPQDQMYREFERQVKAAVKAAVATAAHTAVGKAVPQTYNQVDKQQALDSLQQLERVLDQQNYSTFKNLLEKPIDDSKFMRFSDFGNWKPAASRVQLQVQAQEYQSALNADVMRVRQSSARTSKPSTSLHNPATSYNSQLTTQQTSFNLATNGALGGFQNNYRDRSTMAGAPTVTGGLGIASDVRPSLVSTQTAQASTVGNWSLEPAKDIVQLKKFMLQSAQAAGSGDSYLRSGASISERPTATAKELAALNRFKVLGATASRREVDYYQERDYLRDRDYQERYNQRDRDYREKDYLRDRDHRDPSLFDRYRRESYLDDYRNYVSELEHRRPVRRRFVERNRFGLEGRLLDPVVDPPFYTDKLQLREEPVFEPRRRSIDQSFASRRTRQEPLHSYNSVAQFFSNPPLQQREVPVRSEATHVIHLNDVVTATAVPISSQVYHLRPTRISTTATGAWNPNDFFQPELDQRSSSYSFMPKAKATPSAVYSEVETRLQPSYYAAAPQPDQQQFAGFLDTQGHLPPGFLDTNAQLPPGFLGDQPQFAAAAPQLALKGQNQAAFVGPAPAWAGSGFQADTNYQTNLFQHLVGDINSKGSVSDLAPAKQQQDYVSYLKTANKQPSGLDGRPHSQNEYEHLFGADKSYHAPLAAFN